MSVIPLTLTISLCLVFTFVVFFLRETSRRNYPDAQRNALMPLAEETPLPARAPATSRPATAGLPASSPSSRPRRTNSHA